VPLITVSRIPVTVASDFKKHLEGKEMKLAEALIARADCQKRISQLKERLIESAKVQDGDSPPEPPEQLFAEVNRLTSELENFIRRINRTNAQTNYAAECSLSDALATRDILQMRQSINRQVARAGVIEQNRYSRSEIRYVSTVDIRALLKEADEISKRHRELDASIQAANWTTDLLD
jgi:hypothetical protein